MSTRFIKKSRVVGNTATKYAKKSEPAYILTDERRLHILAQSYLGKKGYTIPKSVLSKEEEEFLKKDLFVRPVTHGGGAGYGVPESAFPVYRENTNKIYIPRFYGVSRYGLPAKSEIDLGENIDVCFDKPLRDYQEKIIKIYTDYVNTGITSANSEVHGQVADGQVACIGDSTLYNESYRV